MNRPSFLVATLAIALSVPAFAQTAATATTTDPIVAGRAEQRAASGAYADALIKAYSDRSAKVDAAVVAAVKEANAKGADPLVAKRDAESKAKKATQAEYDAAVKAATAKYKEVMASTNKKMSAANAGGPAAGSTR